jgi:uncharacterized membrane protein YgdD (TMEM256/DUF423 family)
MNWLTRSFGFFGALFGLIAMVLGALTAHKFAPSLDAEALNRLILGLALALAHALLLLQIAGFSRQGSSGLLNVAGVAVLLGTLLFCGTLIARALLGWPPTLAPLGGTLLMIGWLSLACWFFGARR